MSGRITKRGIIPPPVEKGDGGGGRGWVSSGHYLKSVLPTQGKRRRRGGRKQAISGV